MSRPFRLQSVLKLRNAARDERRKSLADALRAESIVSEQMERLAGEIEEMREASRAAAAPGVIAVERLLSFNRHELLLFANLRELAEKKRKILLEVDVRRRALIEADRDVKAIEKLRERQDREQQLKEDQREQAELDQTALMRSFSARSMR
jgi:flagellar FliJ protein